MEPLEPWYEVSHPFTADLDPISGQIPHHPQGRRPHRYGSVVERGGSEQAQYGTLTADAELGVALSDSV